MSERSKKRIIITLVLFSALLNLLLMVNVFALKRVTRKYSPRRSSEIIRPAAKSGPTAELMTLSKKNLIQTRQIAPHRQSRQQPPRPHQNPQL